MIETSSANTAKTNKQFMILTFLGIVMVVSWHITGGNPIRFFDNIFPVNSFFMPMFIFISGYFFRDKYLKDFKTFFKKKFVNLLVYYFIWNIFYGLIRKALYALGLSTADVVFNWKAIFLSPFIDGQGFGLDTPSWFIPTLFTVEIAYWLLRKISTITGKHQKIIDMILLAIFVVLNAVSVEISDKNIGNEYMLPLKKLMFFEVFFVLGFYYKTYFEKYDNKIPIFISMMISIFINAIVMFKFNDINFTGLYVMNNFHNTMPIIPLITGINGIYFFLKLSKILEKPLGNSKIVNLISNYSKQICMHHIFAMYMFTLIIFLINKLVEVPYFKEENFLNGAGWYFWNTDQLLMAVIYFIIGVFVSILIAKLAEKIKNFLQECLFSLFDKILSLLIITK